MINLQLYKGDTFSRQVTTPYIPLSNYSITAMGRLKDGTKVCDFIIDTSVDQTVYPGAFLLALANTSNLALGTMYVDFQIDDITKSPPVRKHTPQFTIEVNGVITHD